MAVTTGGCPYRALIVALVLLTSACGSRVEGDAADRGGAQVGGTPSTSAPVADDTSAAMVGSHQVKCSPGDGSNSAPPPGEYPDDTKGVTADRVTIGLITDKAGPVKLPTKGIESSARAFVEFCNSLGGVNGRELVLKVYDSAIGRHAEVTKQACDDDVFALVMSGSVLETGAQQMVDCKLVEVPAYTASAAKNMSDRLVQPLPGPATQINSGFCRFMADRYPTAYANAASIYTDLPAASNRARSIMEACEPLGMGVVYDRPIAIGETGWGPIVSEMKARGVQYVTMVSSTTETIGLLTAMADQNFSPEVVDLGQQYYDQELAVTPGAEGTLVLTNSVPFEEAEDSPAMQTFLRWLGRITDDPPTTLGVQAFSAGMLFVEALSTLGDDISRERLLAALGTIHEWDGGGLHFPTDPASNNASSCFLYLRVTSGTFEREFPDDGFACDPSWVVELQGDYGTGATEGTR